MATFATKKSQQNGVKCEDSINLFEFITRHAKTLETVPKELEKKIDDLRKLEDLLKSQKGRHKIRLLKDLYKELDELQQEKKRFELGIKKREYLADSEPYLIQYKNSKDDNARGNISDSVVRLAETQNPVRYRKRSDLTRTIRMASREGGDRGIEKHSLKDEFLSEFHGHAPPVYISHGDLCPNCDTQLERESDSSLVCSRCGVSVQVQDAVSTNVSWNDEMDYVSFQYKRANHFCEWVNTSMAKQNCEIPKDIIDNCMKRLAREKILPEQIDAARIRQVLKELKLRKYYEHSLLIACRLTGKTPPRITPEQEEELRNMFAQMQEPFEQVRDKLFPERKNFLSYSYILFKFCEILGLQDFKQNFTLLKGRDKLHKQDQIFRAICQKLNWSFTPSV